MIMLEKVNYVGQATRLLIHDSPIAASRQMALWNLMITLKKNGKIKFRSTRPKGPAKTTFVTAELEMFQEEEK